MNESDWKKFKKVKDKALERFCSQALNDLREAMDKESDSSHSTYLLVYRLIENSDKRLGFLFNGHSRSKAQFQLMAMRSKGLVSDSDLEGMSDAFIEATKPRQ